MDGIEDNDDEEDLLPVYTTAWEEERRWTREMQGAVPGWVEVRRQLERSTAVAYKNFVLIDGLLHRRTLGKQGMRLRLCVPPDQRLEILDAYHGDRWAAHLGVKRTLGQIEERYYWPRLRQQVLNYVRACPQCQARKNPPVEPQGHMEIIRVERPFEKVGMDIGAFSRVGGGQEEYHRCGGLSHQVGRDEGCSNCDGPGRS
uniref:RNA-directed DNA polymerase n=1 Tax=Daphnia magna TaxID=35525 RepID=A0A0P6C3Y4_9CRUS